MQVNEFDTYKSLKSLNLDKSSGPDGISPWVYKACAEILAYPVSVILNCSYNQGKLPSIWKSANISPIPKDTQITNINKHFRPISCTNPNFIVQYAVQAWAISNMAELNEEKCKELRIDFSREPTENNKFFVCLHGDKISNSFVYTSLHPIFINHKEIEVVSYAKTLGLTVSNDFK